MPRFFFDFDDGQAQIEDDDGLLMTDIDEARIAAIGALPSIARDLGTVRQNYSIKSIVRDEGGQNVFQAELTLKTSSWPEQS